MIIRDLLTNKVDLTESKIYRKDGMLTVAALNDEFVMRKLVKGDGYAEYSRISEDSVFDKRSIAKPAFEYAKALRTIGVNAKVCPAIPGSAKCGNCTMCANTDVNMIIYPVH